MKIPAIVYGAVLGLCAGQATASVLVLPPLQAFASTAAGTATGIESASSVFHQGGENADTQIAFAGSLGPTATISETNACCGVGTNPIANAVYQYAVVLNPGFHVKVGLVPIKWAADLDTRVLETAHFEGGGGKAIVNIGMNSPITVDIEEDCSPGDRASTSAKASAGRAVVPGQAYAVHVGVFGGVTGGIAQVGADPVIQIAEQLIPGTDINFQQAFSLELSPGVVQRLGPGVPEPSTWAMMILGLRGMGFVAYRTRAKRDGRGGRCPSNRETHAMSET